MAPLLPCVLGAVAPASHSGPGRLAPSRRGIPGIPCVHMLRQRGRSINLRSPTVDRECANSTSLRGSIVGNTASSHRTCTGNGQSGLNVMDVFAKLAYFNLVPS